MSVVFVDVDTQLDFLYRAGALYVPGAERLLEKLARLNRHAVAEGIPLVSTMDAHTENDVEFRAWPPHCVARTVGQRKPECTLMAGWAVMPLAARETVKAQQVLVEKVTTDCFTNPMLEKLLDELGTMEAVVYGVVTEICVANAVRGLLRTGRRVTLVQDAVMSLDDAKAQALEAEVVASGGRLATVSQLCG
ncbi:MAG: cysteine hydrolase family protein [Acidobacteria bacterium]|nr:cysteine hydrolase family protein [Acidobacteriota bacterium]